MSDGVILSSTWTRRLVLGLATVGAIGLTIEGTIGKPPDQLDVRGAIPQNLRPDEYVVGVPWTGEPGKVVTVAELEAITAREPKVAGPIERRHEQAGGAERVIRRDNPNAPAVASWPFAEPKAIPRDRRGPSAAFVASTGFNGTSSTESPFIPPDSNGAVGPNHVMVVSNGRFKIFTKTGTQLASFTDTSLFASVTGAGVSDPHIRYDRTSGRWFITEIDVANTSNKILVAVSSGSDITASSSFTVFGFAHDAPGGGGIDLNHFADYDTLGVDANALYVGANEFTSSVGSFLGTTAYVIRKSSVIGGGPIVVTAFRGLATGVGTGAWTPQGVQNDDPSALEGYFIGVDNAAFSILDVYRVSTPGTTPALSGVMQIAVPTTYFPIGQVAGGTATPLDALDDRLFAAELRTNRFTGVKTLWTAHNIRVNTSGVGGSGAGFDRNGSRWYEIGSLATTPALVQAGTFFDSAPTDPSGLWIPSIVMNGQGHALIATSEARASINGASVAYASRLASDPAGTLTHVGLAVSSGGTYNLGTPRRWGDYSQTVVDPNDDMTVWTFQEYVSATNVWTVRATKMQAPGPAPLVSVSPTSVPKTGSQVITITGSALAGGYFDPGPGFPNHLGVTFSGGVTVNSITVVDPTHIQVNINTTAATPGTINVCVSNPDGSTGCGNNLFTVTSSTIVGDFDGDVRADMTLYRSDGQWSILKSTSGYTSSLVENLGGPGYVPIGGDYDGDGRQDIAVYRPTSGQWLALTSSSNFTVFFNKFWGGPGYIPVPGDYDGDGKGDPAVYVEATAAWSILKSSTSYTSTINVTWGGVGYTPVPGQDFDGDGKADVAVYSETTGTWHVLKSSTNYTAALNVPWGGRGYTLVPGDYDGDKKADLGLYQRATGNWFVLLSGAGYTTTLNIAWGGLAFDPVPGDYDGDGKMDLGAVQRATGNWFILLSNGGYTTSLGVMGWGASIDTKIPGAIRVGRDDMRRATDVDGDGKADLTVFNTSLATGYSLLSFEAYTTSASRAWGGTGFTLAPGDFDGDGKLDYGAYENSTGNWTVALSGAGFTTTLNRNAGGGSYSPVVGDYDGDGKSDIAVYNGSTAHWIVLTSSTGFTPTIAADWGGPGYTPVPADYDGDGKTDIGVYQQSSGAWYVLLAASSFTTSMTQFVGGPAWSPVPGDYDGDGKIDFTVYNPTTGQWYGLLSSTSYTTTVNVFWGGPGYTPVQGDFDGDSKVDLAVITSAGVWSILQSSSNYTTTLSKTWGGPAYIPVPKYP